MTMFHDGNRRLQDRYGGRAVADRIVEMVESAEITDEFRDFIQSCSFFFLASSANGVTDCSFKGGAPGFVRVTGPRHLIFPDYDGNRMYKSLGNIVENPNVGLLFMNFGAEEGQGALYLRVRINGRARVHDAHDALSTYPGAQRIVEVEVAHIYPNCPVTCRKCRWWHRRATCPKKAGISRRPNGRRSRRLPRFFDMSLWLVDGWLTLSDWRSATETR